MTMTENLPARQNGGRALNLKAAARDVTTLKSLLEISKQQMADVLPKHLTPERIVRVTLLAVNKTPKLLDCSMESILQSIMQAASLGLDPGGVIGDGYLIPYKGQCQFQPGYRGLVKLARQSGELRDITADVVYEHDRFEYRKGDDAALLHEPDLRAERRDQDIIGAYMVAEFKSGGRHREYMTRQEIEKARRCSSGDTTRADSPWVKWYPEMCKKTVLKRGSKLLPLSSDRFAQAMEIESAQYTDEPAMSKSAKLNASLQVTSRPVSEGQDFDPNPEEVERQMREAAQNATVSTSADGAGESAPAPSTERQEPDTSVAEAEKRAADGGDDLAREAVERELLEQLADPHNAERTYLDAMEAGGATRADAKKCLDAYALKHRVKGKLHTLGREAALSLHQACAAGRVGFDGSVQQGA